MDDDFLSTTLNTFPPLPYSLLQKFDNIIFYIIIGLVITLYIQHYIVHPPYVMSQTIYFLLLLLISRVFNIHQNIHVERAKASIRPPM